MHVVPGDVFVDHRAGRRMRRHILDQALAQDPYTPPVTQGRPVFRPRPHYFILRYCGLPDKPPAQGVAGAVRYECVLALADMLGHRKGLPPQGDPGLVDR